MVKKKCKTLAYVFLFLLDKKSFSSGVSYFYLLANALIAGQADVNLTSSNGNGPLLAACRHGNCEMVTTLVRANAAIESGDNSTQALLAACARGDADSVHVLCGRLGRVGM